MYTPYAVAPMGTDMLIHACMYVQYVHTIVHTYSVHTYLATSLDGVAHAGVEGARPCLRIRQTRTFFDPGFLESLGARLRHLSGYCAVQHMPGWPCRISDVLFVPYRNFALPSVCSRPP